MASDQDADVRSMAEQQLADVNKQHPMFIQVLSALPCRD